MHGERDSVCNLQASFSESPPSLSMNVDKRLRLPTV